MTKPLTLNRTLTEKKLRSALHISFPKEPETEQGIIDFLNTYIDDFASKISAQQDEASLRTKTALREDLRKDLSSKEDVLLTKTELKAEIQEVRAESQQVETRLQSEIQQVETRLRAEIQELRIEIKHLKTDIRLYALLIILAMVILNPGTLQAIRELFPFLR